MKNKFSISVLIATLVAASAVSFHYQAQAQTTKNTQTATVFSCVRSGKGYATIAQRGNLRSAPMIAWQRYVSAEYTPEQRCRAVSQRLTKAVAQNGGRLSNLLLTTGTVNGETVICYVNSGARCSTTNTLFTLSRENAKDPGLALANLLRFGRRASDTPLRESAGGDDEGGSVESINMEQAVEEAFSVSYESDAEE